MNEDRQVEVLLEQAYTQRRLGNWRGAIELCQRALALDPDHAQGHAALAFSLLGAKRVSGAAIEARLGLGLDGNDTYCHYAMAAVLKAERKLDDAWTHCLVVLESDTRDVDVRVLGAQIRYLRGERTEAMQLLRDALELEPSHVDTLTTLARYEMHDKQLDSATEHVEQALRADPSDLDAHTVAGLIALMRGNTGEAEKHARYVLGQDSTDVGGLELWAAIKARRSWILGLWWRFNVFISMRSETGQIALLLGAFIAVRVVIIFAIELDYPGLASFLGWAWLGFCWYTWFAPAIFRWMLNNDLGTVKLDPNY